MAGGNEQRCEWWELRAEVWSTSISWAALVITVKTQAAQ